jgi:hypothetical protein
MLGPSRALPFFFSISIGPLDIGTRVLDLMLGAELAVSALEFDAPTIEIA